MRSGLSLVSGLRGHQQIEQAIFGILLGALRYLVQPLFANHVDRDIHQVANDGFHVAADIAHFGELAGFHFQERRIGELGQPPGDFRFADAGGADHEDVLRHHLFGHFGIQLLTANTVAQRDCNGAFGVGLADDILVELRDDFAGRQLIEQRSFFRGLLRQIDHHQPSSS